MKKFNEKRLFVAIAVIAFFGILFCFAGWSRSIGLVVFCAISYGLMVISASWYLYRWKKAIDSKDDGYDADICSLFLTICLSLVGYVAVWALDKNTDCNPEFARIMKYPTLGLACAVSILAVCRVLYSRIREFMHKLVKTKAKLVDFLGWLFVALFFISLGAYLLGDGYLFSFPDEVMNVLVAIGIVSFIASVILCGIAEMIKFKK